ncbi:MAG: copper resistance protein CopC [Methylococcaceae bacterium]|nr:copper resistance protein CopC [Methylococcaceae bacterium]
MRKPIYFLLAALGLANFPAHAGISLPLAGGGLNTDGMVMLDGEETMRLAGEAKTVNPFAALEPVAGALMLAHAILVKAAPEREATITDIPDEVLLIFNDAVGQEFLALAVIDESGKRVDNHDAKLDFTDHSHLRASIAKLNPGRYTVRYRVLSADGHVVSGKYFFQVQGK